MKKIDKFKYENNGIVIVFTPFVFEGENTNKYSFSVEENAELTQKLADSVKNKQVDFGSIGYCAKALFEIIQNNTFSKLISSDEIKKLFDAFEEKFNEDPDFVTEYIGTKNNPLFSATLMNASVQITSGQGRTKQEARAQALKKLLQATSD